MKLILWSILGVIVNQTKAQGTPANLPAAGGTPAQAITPLTPSAGAESATEPIITNCFDCLKTYPDRKICNLGGRQETLKLEPYDGACCKTDDTSTKCTSDTTNKNSLNYCSKVAKADPVNFYSYCPITSPFLAKYSEHCTGGTSQDFTATQSPQSFSYNKMRNLASAKRYDACIYQISIPDHTWTSGNMIIRFNKLVDTDVKLTAGTGLKSHPIAIIPNNATVATNVEYEIDLATATTTVITTLPKAGSQNVAIDFQYWVDGVAHSDASQFWSKTFGSHKGIRMIVIVVVCILGCVAASCLAKNKAKSSTGENEVLDRLVEGDEDTAQAGFGSSGHMADLDVAESETDGDKDVVILPPPENASPEEVALNEMKQKLARKHMTPEGFFRACDTTYSKNLNAVEFKNKLQALNLDISDGTLSRIIQILDEDYNGTISFEEYKFALQTYNCVGEALPSGDASSEISPQLMSIFKLIKIMRERKLSETELFRMIDVNSGGTLDLKELDEVVSALGDFQKKEVHSINAHFDVDKNGEIDKTEYHDIMKAAGSKYDHALQRESLKW